MSPARLDLLARLHAEVLTDDELIALEVDLRQAAASANELIHLRRQHRQALPELVPDRPALGAFMADHPVPVIDFEEWLRSRTEQDPRVMLPGLITASLWLGFDLVEAVAIALDVASGAGVPDDLAEEVLAAAVAARAE